MSEKRFTFEYDDGQWGVPLFYDDDKKLCFDEVVDLLNEQQDTNDYLEESNSRLQVQLGETLRLVDEQQATINKLNDELELTANTKLYSRRELERKVDEQQAEIERLQKIIDLTSYQLKVQDRILKEVGE